METDLGKVWALRVMEKGECERRSRRQGWMGEGDRGREVVV